MNDGIVSIGECMIEMAPLPSTGMATYRRGFAGDTFNTAVYLARLQSRSVSYMTAVGTDSISDELVAHFEQQELDVSHVRRFAARRPGLYVIETDDDGERRFHYWRGESAAREMLRDLDSYALANELAPFGAIYFSGITLAILGDAGRGCLLGALEILRRRGGARTVAFDPNFRPVLWSDAADARSSYRRAAALCDVVLSTFDDDAALFQDKDAERAAARWLDWGAAMALERTGNRGSLVQCPDAPPVRVRAEFDGRPLDTTGGGDSFNAGFLAAMLDGAGPDGAATFGHQVAGHVVNCAGAIMDRAKWDKLFPSLGRTAGTG